MIHQCNPVQLQKEMLKIHIYYIRSNGIQLKKESCSMDFTLNNTQSLIPGVHKPKSTKINF